jgi:hypothetical protein
MAEEQRPDFDNLLLGERGISRAEYVRRELEPVLEEIARDRDQKERATVAREEAMIAELAQVRGTLDASQAR